ncbi:hypothetical protein ABIB40_001694 [Pedobacter sp. UYP30]|uniref:transposase n=1 Tax=Pedobacter sp. UYP30 TaxID=1756400 RepID=UPI00339B52D4
MQNITSEYINRAEIWLLITTLVYFLMNGAQIFETAVIVPKWTAAPPETFQMFKGKYGLDLKTFWIVIHSLHEITFILAIIFCWKLDIRNSLLILFAIHFSVRVWTLMYFATNIIEFQKIANLESIGTDLLNKTIMWRNLNYIRVGIFIAVSLGLIPLCVKLMNLKIF